MRIVTMHRPWIMDQGSSSSRDHLRCHHHHQEDRQEQHWSTLMHRFLRLSLLPHWSHMLNSSSSNRIRIHEGKRLSAWMATSRPSRPWILRHWLTWLPNRFPRWKTSWRARMSYPRHQVHRIIIIVKQMETTTKTPMRSLKCHPSITAAAVVAVMLPPRCWIRIKINRILPINQGRNHRVIKVIATIMTIIRILLTIPCQAKRKVISFITRLITINMVIRTQIKQTMLQHRRSQPSPQLLIHLPHLMIHMHQMLNQHPPHQDTLMRQVNGISMSSSSSQRNHRQDQCHQELNLIMIRD